ncbi:MAG: hypothetical protein K0S65_4134, partial [Labilithrix sp.]|nr:hypothetical protein [Labilithrix sp.]
MLASGCACPATCCASASEARISVEHGNVIDREIFTGRRGDREIRGRGFPSFFSWTLV